MKLKDIGEFGLIDNIARGEGKPGKRVVVGIGDDAAILRVRNDLLLVATTDTMIEGVHFDLSYSSFYSIGRKSMASNISDCAAMGGSAKEVLVTLGLPSDIEVKDVEELYRGMDALAKKYDIDIVGGDTVSSPKSLMINITLLGEVDKKDLLLRSGAAVGDLIMVTGYLGDAAAGLEILQRRDRACPCPKIRTLTQKHLMPEPRAKEGMLLARSGCVTSMIDNSDGLSRCVIELCRMSGVGAKINLAALPISDETAAFCKKSGLDPIDLAMNGGEDYELVFTVPKRKAARVFSLFKKNSDIGLTVVGEIVDKNKGITVIDEAGRGKPLRSSGFDHFRGKR